MERTISLPREGIFAAVTDGDTRLKFLRDGQWVSYDGDRTIAIHSPVDGSLVGLVPALSTETIDEVFQRAHEAQKGWAEAGLEERVACLYRAADLMERHADTLVDLLGWEIAKNRKDAREEATRSAQYLRFTAEEGRRMHGEMMRGDAFAPFARNKVALTFRVPLGVVLAIPPFNYPVNLAVSKIAPGLICGNSVVLKPPTQGSVSGIYLTAIFQEAGFPPGVMQVVTGRGSEIGDYLTTHPLVNMITFTGSSTIGWRLGKVTGMVPMLMELGGKDAAIVLNDADMELAAKEIVSGAFAYSGQRCTAMKRVLVTDDAAWLLLKHIVPKVEKLSVGNPEDDAFVTPMISQEAAEFVQELIDDALAKGAKLLVGNRREKNLLWPTVIDEVTADMRLAWEEQFGPVLPIIRVKDAAEAVRLANQSEYGLQSAIFTRNIDAALGIAHQLEVGSVQINGKSARGPDHFPFIGVKASGMGAQGVRYSIEAMTRVKAIVFNLHEWQGFSGL
ncbi:MAG: NADP-dependent glyceraldehyde-3-phosphate dehydrogenase [Chloroflexota bacterium]|nr:NADP-dependent glyceraldehyde-3-phosphate dehydrogenase [Chloroflexota bacterium]